MAISKKTYLGFKTIYLKYGKNQFSETAALKIVEEYMSQSTFFKYAKEFCEIVCEYVDDIVEHTPQWFLQLCSERDYGYKDMHCSTCPARDRYHDCPCKRYGHNINNWHTDGNGNTIVTRRDYYYTFKPDLELKVVGYNSVQYLEEKEVKPIIAEQKTLPKADGTPPIPPPPNKSIAPNKPNVSPALKERLVMFDAVDDSIKMFIETPEDRKRAAKILKCSLDSVGKRAAQHTLCCDSRFIIRRESEFMRHEPLVYKKTNCHSLILLLDLQGSIIYVMHSIEEAKQQLHFAHESYYKYVNSGKPIEYCPDDNPNHKELGYLIEPSHTGLYSYEHFGQNLITAGIKPTPEKPVSKTEDTTMGSNPKAKTLAPRETKVLVNRIQRAMERGLSETEACVALGISTTIWRSVCDRVTKNGGKSGNRNSSLTEANLNKWSKFIDEHPEWEAPKTRICDTCGQEKPLIDFAIDENGEWKKSSTCIECEKELAEKEQAIQAAQEKMAATKPINAKEEKDTMAAASKKTKQSSNEPTFVKNTLITKELVIFVTEEYNNRVKEENRTDIPIDKYFVGFINNEMNTTCTTQDIIDIINGHYDDLIAPAVTFEEINDKLECENALRREVAQTKALVLDFSQMMRQYLESYGDANLTTLAKEHKLNVANILNNMDVGVEE